MTERQRRVRQARTLRNTPLRIRELLARLLPRRRALFLQTLAYELRLELAAAKQEQMIEAEQ